ncbi:hypothetical protein FACS189434_10870 [Bacteroidia bacterium]|nr:hypothetical protein FACS189434_10870 [Bacteroidia bacterium]
MIIHQIYEVKPGARISRTVQRWMDTVRSAVRPGDVYKLWNDSREINAFVKGNFPALYDRYKALPYNVQRWDVLRLMILYVEGGVYFDSDVEIFGTLEIFGTASKTSVVFGLEPEEHAFDFERRPFLIGTYFIYAEPGNEFVKYLIDSVFAEINIVHSTHNPTQIMKSTGPAKITEVYNRYPKKFEVSLLSAEYFSPLTAKETKRYVMGEYFPQAENAVGIHYYCGSWVESSENKDEIELLEFLKRKRN